MGGGAAYLLSGVEQLLRVVRPGIWLRGAERGVHPVGASRLGSANHGLDGLDRVAGVGGGFEIVELEAEADDLPTRALGILVRDVLDEGYAAEVEPTTALRALSRESICHPARSAEVGLVEVQEHEVEERWIQRPVPRTAGKQPPLTFNRFHRELDIALSQHLAFSHGVLLSPSETDS